MGAPKTSLPWAVKTCISAITFRNLQQSNCCKRGLNVGGKTRNIAVFNPFLAMLQNKLHVFVARLTVP